MASEIAIIKVPAPLVTLPQFAEREDVSQPVAYRGISDVIPRAPTTPWGVCKGRQQAGGPIHIGYVR
jgi:hypothetical protein